MNRILIISYNEKNKKFNEEDCQDIILRIKKEKPSFIYIGTQESLLLGKNHFQYYLKLKLNENNYELLYKTKTVPIFISNKNLRSRLYYNTESVFLHNKPEKILDKLSDKFFKSTKISINSIKRNNRIPIRFIKSITINSKSKDSIYTEFIFQYNLYFYKFIFVNSLINNNKIEESKFKYLVNEFELPEKLKSDYNIFFCGDLNFILDKDYYYKKNEFNSFLKENSRLEIKSIEIVKEYIRIINIRNKIKEIEEKKNKLSEVNNYEINNLKEKLNVMEKELLKNSELKSFLNNMYDMFNNKNINNKNFYLKLKDSINYLPVNLTSKFKTGHNKLQKTKNLFNININKVNEVNQVNINKKIKEVFDININKNFRLPSPTDVILFAIPEKNNIEILKKNYNMHLLPDKSDHKMISLLIEFNNNKIDKKSINKNVLKNQNIIAQPLNADADYNSNNNEFKNAISLPNNI